VEYKSLTSDKEYTTRLSAMGSNFDSLKNFKIKSVGWQDAGRPERMMEDFF
jgi:hypothetical protein